MENRVAFPQESTVCLLLLLLLLLLISIFVTCNLNTSKIRQDIGVARVKNVFYLLLCTNGT